MNINDKTVVLTGAASGIGLAVLKRLNAFDCQVIAVDLQAVEITPDRATIYPYQVDLSQPSAVDAIIEFALEKTGKVDVFIANAGFAYYGHFHELSWEQIENIHRVNVFSPLYTINKMREINTEREHLVVITASAMSHLPIVGYAIYSATKASLHHFAWAYSYERPRHARLMLVYPIATRTHFFGKSPVLYPNQTAEYVAGRLINGIEHNRTQVMPSIGFRLFYAIGRVFPPLYKLYLWYTSFVFRRWLKSNHAR